MRPLEILILSLFIVSTVLISIISAVYVKFRLSIKYPNNMFFITVNIQLIGGIFVILAIFMTQGLPSFYSIEGDPFVQFLLYGIKLVKILAFHAVIAINIEIYIKLKRKLIIKYHTRAIIYILYSVIISVVLTLFGNPLGEGLIDMGKAGIIFSQIYVLSICCLLIITSLYFYCSYCVEIRSKDMVALLMLSVIGVVVGIIQSLLSIILESGTSYSFNSVSYFLLSIEGFAEFFILCLSPKFREYIKLVIMFKSQESTVSSLSSDRSDISMIEKNIEDFRFTKENPGLFSDIFESITTNVSLI